MHPFNALDIATQEFSSRLALVGTGQWKSPTPCTDWDVRYLVAHVVGGNRFAALVLQGESADNAMEEVMTVRQLSDDPGLDFAASSSEQRREFDAPGRLAASVDHPVGSMPAARFLSLRVVDIALHAWDLAIAINANPDLNKDLVATVHGILLDEGGGACFGISPLGLVGPHSSAQDRMLDLMGRQPPTEAAPAS